MRSAGAAAGDLDEFKGQKAAKIYVLGIYVFFPRDFIADPNLISLLILKPDLRCGHFLGGSIVPISRRSHHLPGSHFAKNSHSKPGETQHTSPDWKGFTHSPGETRFGFPVVVRIVSGFAAVFALLLLFLAVDG